MLRRIQQLGPSSGATSRQRSLEGIASRMQPRYVCETTTYLPPRNLRSYLLCYACTFMHSSPPGLEGVELVVERSWFRVYPQTLPAQSRFGLPEESGCLNGTTITHSRQFSAEDRAPYIRRRYKRKQPLDTFEADKLLLRRLTGIKARTEAGYNVVGKCVAIVVNSVTHEATFVWNPSLISQRLQNRLL
jgi:hypothetical protein